MKRLCIQITILILFSFNSVFAEISYKEILDNPTDLELNLNYAKQQEKAGNFKLTIATLERLNILYPSNSEIKLYIITIKTQVDTKIKVE